MWELERTLHVFGKFNLNIFGYLPKIAQLFNNFSIARVIQTIMFFFRSLMLYRKYSSEDWYNLSYNSFN